MNIEDYSVLLVVSILIFVLIKNSNTYKNRKIILNAIYQYKVDCAIKNISFNVDYNDMESYNMTIFRFWDFGYKNILPKEKFEIIKKYIGDKQ